MKSLKIIFRRTHLFLGMFLVPWIFVYAFSTFMLNHGPTFRSYRPEPDAWKVLWNKDYSVDLPKSQEELRTWAASILKDNNLDGGPVGVNRDQQRVLINSQRFLAPIRVSYNLADKQLVAEQREKS